MKCTALVAARTGSERMPGKVIRELAGIPSLVHIFKILNESVKLDGFAVVTTVLKEDDIVEDICRKHSVRVFRGSVHDVLDRFRIAAEILRPELIVRVTGDDPLMDPEIIDKVIAAHKPEEFDYTSNIIQRTFPRGMDTEVINYETLERCWRSTSDRDDHEHVTLYIRRNPDLFRLQNITKEGKPLSELRLCLDTEKDYELIKTVYDKLYCGRPIKLSEILEFLEENPGMQKINSGVVQKDVKGIVY
ncbi:MAG: glycosyltransferase family protein [Ignavibacteria bacterium]|nr:glycosyltransferase family protein [Ignavibacteria bacterium]